MLNCSAFSLRYENNENFCGFTFFFVDFQNFTKTWNFWRQLFVILSINNPALGSSEVPLKCLVCRFSRFDVYRSQTNRHANKYVFRRFKGFSELLDISLAKNKKRKFCFTKYLKQISMFCLQFFYSKLTFGSFEPC